MEPGSCHNSGHRATGKTEFLPQELYDIENDPHQLRNVAAHSDYADVRRELTERFTRLLRESGDPRELGSGHGMDTGDCFGGTPEWPGDETIERFRER